MSNQVVVVKEVKNEGSSACETLTINSTDALAMIEHSSELSIRITTPIGTKFQCKTSFIGTHDKSLILIEVPNISDDDLNYFFQEGFWINGKAISPRGEGGMIHFRSQLIHYIREPIAMVGLSVPSTMQVTQLRKEPRYDVNLSGQIVSDKHKGDCEIRDLSKSGCRFITQPLSHAFQIGERVAIGVKAKNKQVLPQLVGKICNSQQFLHHTHYGLKFDDVGIENSKSLLAQLKFNGIKLAFR